jgi:hypothetical protein
MVPVAPASSISTTMPAYIQEFIRHIGAENCM